MERAVVLILIVRNRTLLNFVLRIQATKFLLFSECRGKIEAKEKEN